jgi:hypothetical protein
MKTMHSDSFSSKKWFLWLAAFFLLATRSFGWENLPQKPFGQANLLPEPHQFVIAPFYSYTRWIHFYDDNGDKRQIPQNLPEEDFEVNDGMLNLEYGISRDWALDLTIGVTSGASRFFDPNNAPHTDWGMMDTQLGVRYRIVDERETSSTWMPTLTARLGAIITGTYQADFPFAPGTGGTGAELALFANKALGDFGLNLYGDMAWRFRNRDVPVKVQTRIGLYYDIEFHAWILRTFTPNVAYKFLNSFGGSGVSGNGPNIQYSHDVREVSHILESGLGMTTAGGSRVQFYFDWGFMGENTPAVMTYGLYVSFPMGGKK